MMNSSGRIHGALLPLRRMFYAVLPSECDGVVDVNVNYVKEAQPFFILMVIMEWTFIWMRQQRRQDSKTHYTGVDFADAMSSISAGILTQLPLLFGKSMEVLAYVWVHKRYRLVTFEHPYPLWLWLTGLVGVDLGYYWVHRACHEVSLLWTGHQMHHSSQRYNLSTAIRQGALQRLISWPFYLPLALVLPLPLFLAHIQLNLLFQFWIHTEVISTLWWPLEWIFNTPSHHRVHHGRHRYCVDKNYGGTLIIFDRLFGTFQSEFDDPWHENCQPIAYGSIPPVQSWEPMGLQLSHVVKLVANWRSTRGLGRRLRGLLCGPGYVEGGARLGDPRSIPAVEQPVQMLKHKCRSPSGIWIAGANMICCYLLYVRLIIFASSMTLPQLLIGVGFVVWSLSDVGKRLDGAQPPGWAMELLRLTLFSYTVLN